MRVKQSWLWVLCRNLLLPTGSKGSILEEGPQNYLGSSKKNKKKTETQHPVLAGIPGDSFDLFCVVSF